MFFQYRLAHALKMTVRQLLESLDSRELTNWRAFDRMYPIGEERADLRAGIIAAKLHNVHRGPNDEPGKASDYMFEYRPTGSQPEQTEDEISAAMDTAIAELRELGK